MVLEWKPPAREPTSSGVGRRSTIATFDAHKSQLTGQHHGGTAAGNDHISHHNSLPP